MLRLGIELAVEFVKLVIQLGDVSRCPQGDGRDWGEVVHTSGFASVLSLELSSFSFSSSAMYDSFSWSSLSFSAVVLRVAAETVCADSASA